MKVLNRAMEGIESAEKTLLTLAWLGIGYVVVRIAWSVL